jgi:hypothetical protein
VSISFTVLRIYFVMVYVYFLANAKFLDNFGTSCITLSPSITYLLTLDIA